MEVLFARIGDERYFLHNESEAVFEFLLYGLELAVGFACPPHLAYTKLRRISGRNQEAEKTIVAVWFAPPLVCVFLDMGLLDDDCPHSERRSPPVQLS